MHSRRRDRENESEEGQGDVGWTSRGVRSILIIVLDWTSGVQNKEKKKILHTLVDDPVLLLLNQSMLTEASLLWSKKKKQQLYH